MMETQSVFGEERAKYEKIWTEVEGYRKVSFGEMLVGSFLALSGIKPGQYLVDVGCGVGRASLVFAKLGVNVTMVDLSLQALDDEVREALQEEFPVGSLHFVEKCAWQPWVGGSNGEWDWAYCCDVLEHIPQEFTMLVVERCLQAAERVFLHINFDPDHFGSKIGEPLHLTVKPFTWWRDRLAELGELTDARDMIGHGMFVLGRMQ